MTEPRGLIDRVLDQVVEETGDNQQVLADLAVRLEPFANELMAVWAKGYREVVAHQTFAEDVLTHTVPDEAVRAFFSELKQGNLRGACAAFGAWGLNVTRAGLDYAAVLKYVRESQRAMVSSFVIRAYEDDPQLPLVLDAFDDLFDGILAAISAAYVEATQMRFTEGMPLHTLGRLSGGAAHALNNLLAAIHGRTQLLIERISDAEMRDELREIQSTAAIGAQVMRRVQSYVQVDSGGRLNAADVNLGLRGAAELTRFLWRDQAQASGVVIDVVQDFADVPPVQMRPTALRQVLVALILNAVEAMPGGGLITLRTERKDDYVLASVIDNGEGMSENVRVHIFEPFYTTKGTPHLGLGLSAAAKIVADYNGTLMVDSNPGHGTTVTLSLPIARGVIAGETRPMVTTRAANILIIDNEPSVRELLSRLLRLHGHYVVAAESGTEGIAAFKEGKFDLVFTDLGMPEMSGWDVAREIKQINPKVPIALITGWPIDLSYKELKERNVDKVVSKPFDIPQLLGMIDDVLAARAKK